MGGRVHTRGRQGMSGGEPWLRAQEVLRSGHGLRTVGAKEPPGTSLEGRASPAVVTAPRASPQRHPPASRILFLFPSRLCIFHPDLASPLPRSVSPLLYPLLFLLLLLAPAPRSHGGLPRPLPPATRVLLASSRLPKGDLSADLSSAPSLTNGSRGEQVHTELVAGLPFHSRPEQAVLVKNTFPKVEINVFMCKLIHTYIKT